MSLYHPFYSGREGVRIIRIQCPPGLLIKAIAQPEPGGGGSRPLRRKWAAKFPRKCRLQTHRLFSIS